MIKIYIGQILPEVPYTEILYPNLGNKERTNPFGESLFVDFKEPLVEIVNTPEEAEYLCIPHNYNYVKKHESYLEEFVVLAEKYSKKILIFFPGDSDEEVQVPHSVVFRNSQYNYKKQDNEIIMPGFAYDLGKSYGVNGRTKSDLPVVGFCGWASYTALKSWVTYGMYNLLQSLVGHPAHKRGLYFRRAALTLLKKSQKVRTNFIIRSSYSGSTKTLTVDPDYARREYVENIKESDFTLSPKGDGNFSVRFFESLSLGRIPLLIDTDCPLPLEGEINYDDFILRVDHKELSKLPDIVSDFYTRISPESYSEKQKKCREVFEKYLKIDVFFRHVLQKDALIGFDRII